MRTIVDGVILMASSESSSTVLFEKKYKVNIKNFKSTEEIDEFVESKLGRKLKSIKLDTNIVDNTGNVIEVKEYDIDSLIDKALNNKKSLHNI